MEKIWIQSLHLEGTAKEGTISREKGNNPRLGCLSKNCYLLFKSEEPVQKAIQESNNQVFQERHLHVTRGNHVERDFKHTLLVGNLPLEADEEEIRTLFEDCGKIDYVRVLRDKNTF